MFVLELENKKNQWKLKKKTNILTKHVLFFFFYLDPSYFQSS
jgi:hypothetical protein